MRGYAIYLCYYNQKKADLKKVGSSCFAEKSF